MREVVIVEAVRTAVGKFGGALTEIPAPDMAAIVVKEAIQRSQVDPAMVDEVIMGQVLINGETPNIAREASLKAGLSVDVPSYTIDRQCGSSLQAIVNAYLQIQTGNSNIVVAGGAEAMSRSEYYVTGARWGFRMGNQVFYDRFLRHGVRVSTDLFGEIPNMMFTAENVASQLGITREEQDLFALSSHQKACAAIDSGRFKDEIVPVPVPRGKKETVLFDTDEHPRSDATLESLSKLPSMTGKTVTAGNSSGINDAAAACVVMAADVAERLGLEPMGYIRGFATAGVDPRVMGLGPVPAVKKLLEKTGVKLQDIDLIELNEAFAAQALGVIKQLGITDLGNMNVNGSGIAIGHPIGATGARIMATMLHEMRRRKARFGLETMCIGGGMGIAVLVERC